MEANSITIMRLAEAQSKNLNRNPSVEVITPIIVDAPTDHLKIYPEFWASQWTKKMQYWGSQYKDPKDNDPSKHSELQQEKAEIIQLGRCSHMDPP